MKKNKLNLLIDGVLLMLTGGLAGGGFFGLLHISSRS